ncbi:MAG TPA: aminopeptidase P N-terminal domain-containing protein [Candidatus Saccharimonadia bacterium]
MRYQPLPAAFHAANRAKLAQFIGEEAIAIIDTADKFTRRGDFEYPFRPDSNFYYLTGIDEPEAVLVLVPGHANPQARELLFTSGTSEFVSQWEGGRHTAETAKARSGIANILPLENLDFYLDRLMAQYHTIYLNAEDSVRSVMPHPALRRAQWLQEKAPVHRLKSALPILDKLRSVKAPEEIEHIRQAVAITKAAIAKAEAIAAAGRYEDELEAELLAEFTRQGATAAWPPIVAAGANTTIIHYAANAAQLKARDSVLIDTGAEYGYYAADISRTFPLHGKEFTKRQQAVYDVVQAAQAAGIAATKPGKNLLEIDDIMQAVLTEGMKELGLKGDLRDYYPHMSHHLGLDIHDTGGPRQPLEPGAVITCEPGLYIKAEGIGVRLEDNVLVTKTGHEVL